MLRRVLIGALLTVIAAAFAAPALAVTQVLMPNVSGVEMIASMRGHPELASLPAWRSPPTSWSSSSSTPSTAPCRRRS